MYKFEIRERNVRFKNQNIFSTNLHSVLKSIEQKMFHFLFTNLYSQNKMCNAVTRLVPKGTKAKCYIFGTYLQLNGIYSISSLKVGLNCRLHSLIATF